MRGIFLSALAALAACAGAMPDGQGVAATVRPAPAEQLAARPAQPSAQARGRTILSAAFVRVGPDGVLTVERHDGRVLVLRAVTMGVDKFCGLAADAPAGRHCDRYAVVASARPGGGGEHTSPPAPFTSAGPLPRASGQD